MTTFALSVRSGAAEPPVLVASGDLDLVSAHRLIDGARELIREDAGAVVRLDLTDVTFMDSTGLGALIELRNLLAEREKTLALVGRSRQVRRAIALTGLEMLFPEPPAT